MGTSDVCKLNWEWPHEFKGVEVTQDSWISGLGNMEVGGVIHEGRKLRIWGQIDGGFFWAPWEACGTPGQNVHWLLGAWIRNPDEWSGPEPLAYIWHCRHCQSVICSYPDPPTPREAQLQMRKMLSPVGFFPNPKLFPIDRIREGWQKKVTNE